MPVLLGGVIWFHSHLFYKSLDNDSTRFRCSYVAHNLSAQADWAKPYQSGRYGQWIRGETFPHGERDVLPVEESEIVWKPVLIRAVGEHNKSMFRLLMLLPYVFIAEYST